MFRCVQWSFCCITDNFLGNIYIDILHIIINRYRYIYKIKHEHHICKWYNVVTELYVGTVPQFKLLDEGPGVSFINGAYAQKIEYASY